jgi:hypothetical protein
MSWVSLSHPTAWQTLLTFNKAVPGDILYLKPSGSQKKSLFCDLTRERPQRNQGK